MSRTCCECHAPIAGEGYPVGDLQGCRTDEVCCSLDCQDALIFELHDGVGEPENCQCDSCWRHKRRQAHAIIARHKGPRPEMRLLGELFAEEK